MNPTLAIAMLMHQAMVGCLGGIFKASFVSLSCIKTSFPSISDEEGGQIKASLKKGKLL